jgi:hypothetical protein
MQAFNAQLRQGLADHGWEVVEVIDSDDWWADEYWKAHSRRSLWGYEVVLTFLVDPMWDSPRKKGQGVWGVSATEGVPTDRLTAERRIGGLCLVKGRFPENIKVLLAALDAHRNDLQRAAGGRA